MSTVLISGGFDPIHVGHIEYMRMASKLGDRLVVAVNSDEWLIRKKGKNFHDYETRVGIVSAVRYVDDVAYPWNDRDGTACDAIRWCLERPSIFKRPIIFANGGDRTPSNTPEMDEFQGQSDVVFSFGVGSKVNASSDILRRWDDGLVQRKWGTYRTVSEGPNYKVKELVIDPGGKIAEQKHFRRDETWTVVAGQLELTLRSPVTTFEDVIDMNRDTGPIVIDIGWWHTAVNVGDEPCRVIEVQTGEYCEERDIERK